MEIGGINRGDAVGDFDRLGVETLAGVEPKGDRVNCLGVSGMVIGIGKCFFDIGHALVKLAHVGVEDGKNNGKVV
jgi:hypothetical protein